MKSNLDDDRLVEVGVVSDCNFLLAFQKEDGCRSLRRGSFQGSEILQDCAQSRSLRAAGANQCQH